MFDFKNILIIRTDRMGDVVLTTPAIKALRQTFPNSKISMLVTPATIDLIKGNPYLDEVLIDDRKKLHKGMRGFFKLVSTLKSAKFDLVVIFHTKKRTNLLCFLAGIPHRLGYRNDKFGFFLNHPIFDTRHEGKKHESQYCLDLLKEVGITTQDNQLFVPINPGAMAWVEKYLEQNQIKDGENFIAIHPGASDPSRCWPAYRFAELINALTEKYQMKIMLVGDQSIQHISNDIIQKTKVPIINATGQTTLAQLVALLKRSVLLISNDSGPVHAAAGVGTPVVSIFTRNQPGINPQRWHPLGPRSQTISVAEDKSISFTRAGRPIDPKYLELITTNQVLQAVDAVFKLC